MELRFLQLCISLSLFHVLKNHPQVYLTPGYRKVEHRKVFVPPIKVISAHQYSNFLDIDLFRNILVYSNHRLAELDDIGRSFLVQLYNTSGYYSHG